MNHSPVVIEDDIDDQIKKLYNQIKNLEKQKPAPQPEKDLSEVWRYFRKNEHGKISAKRFTFFYEGSYHAIEMPKAKFKKKLLEHFDIGSCAGGAIRGIELLDGYIWKPRPDGKYFNWRYDKGIFTHAKEVENACRDGHLIIHSANCRVVT